MEQTQSTKSSGPKRVTSITSQIKRKGRVNIFLDGEFWSGAPALSVEGLQVGTILDAEGLERLVKKIGEGEALQYALNYLSQWPASEKKMREKLIGREFSEEVADHVLDLCKKYGYIDDEALAEGIVDGALRAGKSQRWTRERMSKKGIEPDLQTEILEEKWEEEQEEEGLIKLVEKHPGNLRINKERDKITRRLIARGYPSDMLRRAIAARLEKEPELEEEEKLANDPAKRAVKERSPEYEKDLQRAWKKYNMRNERAKAVQFLIRRGWRYDHAIEALSDGTLPNGDQVEPD